MMDIILWGDRFWQGGTNFGSKNWSGGPVLAAFSAKIGPAGPVLGGTDFGVTVQIWDPKGLSSRLRIFSRSQTNLHASRLSMFRL